MHCSLFVSEIFIGQNVANTFLSIYVFRYHNSWNLIIGWKKFTLKKSKTFQNEPKSNTIGMGTRIGSITTY